MTQLTGHAWVLQGCDSSSGGQFAPCLIIVLERFCVPVPQDLSQSDQPDQSETVQPTGHAWVLQGCDSSSGGQLSPCCVTVLVRFCVPVPQDLLQSDQLDQSDTVQPTGGVTGILFDASAMIELLDESVFCFCT
jgi:hypothetical protein